MIVFDSMKVKALCSIQDRGFVAALHNLFGFSAGRALPWRRLGHANRVRHQPSMRCRTGCTVAKALRAGRVKKI
jgi:hypothetical protein